MNLTVQRRFFIVSLLAVMLVYLPSSVIGVIAMDDLELLERLERMSSTTNFWALFFRDKSTVYYRPLLAVINLMDYKIWGDSLIGYHLTNYAFHVLNAILLYIITFKIFRHVSKPYIPASISMLVFALNPLTCESVAWISGRSDIFGTFFSLLAALSFMSASRLKYLLTPLLIMMGISCKENAFGIIPVLIILNFALHFYGFNSETQHGLDRERIIRGLKTSIQWGFLLCLPVLVYVLIRTSGGSSFDVAVKRISTAGGHAAQSTGYALAGYLKVFPAVGFYLKKIVVPYPLNFSISTINYSFYSWLTLGVLLINIFSVIKRKFALPVITLALISSFAPALAIAIGGVAWTPFAERYLYLALCVWAVAIAFLYQYMVSNNEGNKSILPTIIIVLILISNVFGTLGRQKDWKSNFTLLSDTVEKISSDNFRAMLNFSLAYGGKDRIQYLKKAEIASEKSNDKQWKSKLYLAIAEYYAVYNREFIKLPGQENAGSDSYLAPVISERDAALEMFKYLDKAMDVSDRLITVKTASVIILKYSPKDESLKQEVFERAKSYYTEINKRAPSAFYLYKLGGMNVLLNQFDEAAMCFKDVINNYPETEYATFSKTRLHKLTKNGSIQATNHGSED